MSDILHGLESVSRSKLDIALALIERERRVLGEIASGKPLSVVLENLLLEVEAQAGHRMLTSILFVSEDGKRLLHGAGPSLPTAYNEAIHGIDVGEGIGSCGTAIARKMPVYATDIATDPIWKDYRDLALSHNLRACWSSPIQATDGVVVGSFAIYYDEPRVPTSEDIEAIAFVTQTAALAITHHISDEKIRHSQEQLRQLNDTLEFQVAQRTEERDRAWRLSQDLLVIASADGTFEAINASWSRLLGWEEADLIGKNVNDIVHPDDLAPAAEVFARMLEVPLVHSHTYRVRKKDNTYCRFAWTGAYEAGKVYASGRDVTLEQEQADALRQSQKMEAVGQLTGGIAHDFNNLLMTFRSNLHLMDGQLPEHHPIRTYLDRLGAATDRGASLTGQLLAFSRTQKLDVRPVNLQAALLAARELMGNALGPNVQIDMTIGNSHVWVLTDDNQFQLAILNLAINARDAMPKSGMLRITTTERIMEQVDGKSKHFVGIHIADNGSGMSPEVAARATEPFFTTKEHGKGTGLGLAQVYGVIKQCGGELRIDSKVGRGTTIDILLPASHEHTTVASDAAMHVAQVPRPAFSEIQPLLLIDDDDFVRTAVAEVLRIDGYHVVEANDGVSALRVLETLNPCVAVIDFLMPGLNGAQVARAAQQKLPKLPIIFVSGYADTIALDKISGAVVLRKPVPPTQLLNAVASAVASAAPEVSASNDSDGTSTARQAQHLPL